MKYINKTVKIILISVSLLFLQLSLAKGLSSFHKAAAREIIKTARKSNNARKNLINTVMSTCRVCDDGCLVGTVRKDIKRLGKEKINIYDASAIYGFYGKYTTVNPRLAYSLYKQCNRRLFNKIQTDGRCVSCLAEKLGKNKYFKKGIDTVKKGTKSSTKKVRKFFGF